MTFYAMNLIQLWGTLLIFQGMTTLKIRLKILWNTKLQVLMMLGQKS
jgi:hypothetical protein